MALKRRKSTAKRNNSDLSVGPKHVIPPTPLSAALELGADSPTHRPIRMCIGCRERLPQAEMVRLQLTQEGVRILEPWDKVGPGRSVYVCPDPDCFDKALRRGEIAFKRSKYDKISVRLEPRQAERLKYAFAHAARRLRGMLGVGPR